MAARYDLPIPYGWYCIALSSELNAGEVKPLHYFGKDLVLFRTECGEAKVLDAFCPHLGAHLGHGGTVVENTIRCPFHAWRFDGNGVCAEVPYAKNIPPKVKGGPCMPSYHVVELNQLIWAWYHPDNCAPLFEVHNVEEFSSEDWTDIHLEEWTINSIIQETSENGVDAAHFQYVHNSAGIPAGDVVYNEHRRDAHFVGKAPDIDEEGNVDTTGTKWRESILDTSNVGPGQTIQRFRGLFDTVMQGTVTPIDTQSLHLRFVFTQPKNQRTTQQLFADGVRDNVTEQVQQDIPIWENKVYRESPVLCDGDGPIAKHRKWFSQFYAELADDAGV